MTSTSYSLRKKTGPKPAFSKRDVVDTALELSFEVGLDKITMAEVASRLKVGTSALYRVLESRDTLLKSCLERISLDLKDVDPKLNWKDQLRQYGHNIWNLLEKYPGLDQTVLAVYWAHRIFVDYGILMLELLEKQGVAGDDAELALSLISNSALSSHRMISTLRNPVSINNPSKRGFDALIDYCEEEIKTNDKNASRWQPDPDWLTSSMFDKKIDLVIIGIVGLLEKNSGK